MHPAIAAVAKELIESYGHLKDDPETMTRLVPPFVSALGTSSPLVIVDTADLNPWCGKMPGSLSRFNFLSGQVAAELAALYAADYQPDLVAPKIGIVNPYAAQRRYLNSLVKTLHLERWVTAGTVHTFQGNECDVIIFDSVLGEPHWTARLTNPHEFKQVRRDLNVAVTRARHQFVFVGDSTGSRRTQSQGLRTASCGRI
jgi:superfamily I DNA and/or RNA helicase